jgi:two-component system sensor histidine kinase DegS
MITSGVFGGIAALNFGFGKVSLRKRIGLGESHCEVCVYLEKNGESAQEGGIIYTPEAMASADEHARIRFDAHKIIQAQEDERKRIAVELHDGPLQALVNLHYRLETVEHLLQLKQDRAYRELDQLKLALDRCITDIKSLLVDMRPPMLDDLGVVAALRRLLCDFRRDSKIKAKITTKGTARRLSASAEITIYRLIEEALANVRKHAMATAAELTLEYSPRNLVVRLKDNGTGFDSQEVLSLAGTRHTLGLLGMKERAGLIGGSIDINSQIGKGTEVIVSVPFE